MTQRRGERVPGFRERLAAASRHTCFLWGNEAQKEEFAHVSAMKDSPDVEVVVDIPRTPAEVRAWWTDLPQDYRAADPREQPHHVVTKSRDAQTWVIDTYWRAPLAPNLKIPETFTFRPEGWDVEARLPGGLQQHDEFTLTPTSEGTRVRIRVWVRARHFGGRATLPFYRNYARKNFPKMWRGAGKLCARDAPKLA